MKAIRLLYLVTTLLTLGLYARPASALICCSACADELFRPRECRHGCSIRCTAEEEQETAAAMLVYDEAAGLCYVTK